MITYRYVNVVSIIAIIFSFMLGISYFVKVSEQWVIWAQQSLLWIGILGGAVGNILTVLERRISELEKQVSKSGAV